MVNIIINDNGNTNPTSEDVIDLLKSLKIENNELKDLIIEMKKELVDLHSEVLILKNNFNNESITIKNKQENNSKEHIKSVNQDKPKNDGKVKKSTNVKKKQILKRGRANKNAPYAPNKSMKTKWKHLELLDDGRIINRSNRTYILPIHLNELLYLQEKINNGFTFAESRQLMKKYDMLPGIFGKLVYNLTETDSFEKVFKKYEDNLKKAKFSIENKYIYVNNVNTNIPVKLAREWVQILANTSKKQEKILALQSANKDIDSDMIRIVCDSYNNSHLNAMIKNNEKTMSFVENNPSKRKNLIMNGGLI